MNESFAALMTDFHFLRPAWLWLLPVAIWVIWQLKRVGNSSGGWQQFIDPPLLKVLQLEDPRHTRSSAPWIAGLLLILGALSLAGPSWERLPEPVHQKQDALIIALSLHESMLASDVQPTRLERARFEIRDILAARKEGITALVVFSADAHVVTPLTDDARTIDAMLPVLEPGIMPSRGDNPLAAITAAAELLKGAGLGNGRLLLVTDQYPENMHEAGAEALARAGLQLSILAVGTDEGSPIQLRGGGFLRDVDGSILVPTMKAAEISEGAARAGGRFSVISAAGADIEYLVPSDPFADLAQQEDDVRLFDNWLDRGPWLALLMLPLAALGFRRGWLFMLPLLILPSPPADAIEWQDLWLRPDQQAALARESGDTATAASLFEDPAWKGTAAYENGDFEGSAESFAQGDSADDDYNRGNALARSGKLEDAIAAYDQALEKAPDMEDAAANKALLEQLLQQQNQQDQQQSGDDQQQGDQGEQGEDNQRDSKQGDDANDGDQSENNSESSSDGSTSDNQQPEQSETSPTDNPEDGEQQDQDGSQSQDAEQQEQPEQESERPGREGENANQSPQAQAMAEQDAAEDAEQQQAVEQWLRQVPDRPGELLRRKFEYEYRLRQQAEQD